MVGCWQGGSSSRPIIIRQASPADRGHALLTWYSSTVGRALDLDFHLEGAPNWRAPREESLNVYGVAQPTLPGLKGILSLLGCRPPVARQQTLGESKPASADTAPDTRRLSLDDSKRIDGTNTQETTQGRCVWFCTREEPISAYLTRRGWALLITGYSLYQRTTFCPEGYVRTKDDNGAFGPS
jgi:hypothetical protein